VDVNNSTSSVLFNCECGELLVEKFTGNIYNYHTCRCENCGRMWEVSRPRIEKRTNFTLADEKWLKEKGFK
jgi:hypothetical protein